MDLRNERGWKMPYHELRKTLGIPIGRLPADLCVAPAMIDNIQVWVTTSDRGRHRVLASCPHCSKGMSAGRLHQHLKACT